MEDISHLIHELFEQTEDRPRCPHIRRDREGSPYCGNGLAAGAPNLAKKGAWYVMSTHYSYGA